MFDLLSEHRLSLTELARKEGVSVPTAWRWAQRGCKGIRIQTIQIGGRRFTTREAFARFVEATTAAANGPQPATAARTNRQRQAAIKRAEKELDSAGI